MSALQWARLNILEVASGKSSGSARQTLRTKVKTYIANHLRNGDLSIDAVAHSCGCSRRYIHKMFSAAGQTAGHYILESRLAGSANDLTSPELDHLSITDIAVSWGFNSSSTFSRAFRKHFKISPRAYRAARQEPPEASSFSNVQHQPGTPRP
jgi:AraC-like DNA-binding protein